MHISLIVHWGLQLKHGFAGFLIFLQFYMINCMTECIRTVEFDSSTLKKSIAFLNFIRSGSFTLHLLKQTTSNNNKKKPHKNSKPKQVNKLTNKKNQKPNDNNNKPPENQTQTLLGFIPCWWNIFMFSFHTRYRAL